MAKKAVEFKVGIVVILGVILFLATILWLQGYQFRQSNTNYKIVFDRVGGLKKGDFVTVSGVNMGKVADVELTKSGGVITTLTISDKAYLQKDAVFTVKNYGLMGERYVSVDPGTAEEPLDPDKVIEGQTDAGTSELIGLFGETMRDIQKILDDIKNTVASEENLENLTELASTMNQLAISMDEFFGNNAATIRKTFDNVAHISTRLSQFVDSTAPKIDTTLSNFAEASVALKSLTDSLEAISSKFHGFLDDIERGEGTLGLLSEDETLYQDVKRMVRAVDMIIEDIRRDPKKYIQIKLEIF